LISNEELKSAAFNVFHASLRLKTRPRCAVVINDRIGFNMDHAGCTAETPEGIAYLVSAETPVLRVTMPEAVLRDILDRKAHWNNAEIGCLIQFERKGHYMPDVHTLLSFFHLPKEDPNHLIGTRHDPRSWDDEH
jgi:hypothetical protein